ncbi:MAG: glycerophosphodiester phosphodiesterase [Candidatus Poribacteria bacterium]|nr:MAG: glycerophosphodiester phosphodiesterase [Candidatus Poribacteria bacterium]
MTGSERLPVRIAHRGASDRAPENTLAAIREAIALGCDAVEFDVRVTRDGVPVLLHDATLERTTDGSGSVAALTWEELRRLDAGSWKGPAFAGEPVPTLEEALRAVPEEVTAVVELKTLESAVPAVRVVQRLDRIDRVVFISFLSEALERARSVEPALSVGWLIGELPVPDDSRRSAQAVRRRLAQLGTGLLDAAETLVEEQFLQELRRFGLACWVWTVDSPARMAELIRIGVDGITTNRLDRLNAFWE